MRRVDRVRTCDRETRRVCVGSMAADSAFLAEVLLEIPNQINPKSWPSMPIRLRSELGPLGSRALVPMDLAASPIEQRD